LYTVALSSYLKNSLEYIASGTSDRFKIMYAKFGNGANQHSYEFTDDELYSILLYIDAMSN